MQNNVYKKCLLTAIIASGIYAIPSSIAATQGLLNPTSTGSFDVSVTIPDRVRITGMQDISFGTYVSGDFDDDYPVCVYSNTPTAQYGVTASGDGASSAFTITNGTDAIAYRVRWNSVAGTTVGESALTANVKLDNIPNANQQSSTCATGGNSANLHVQIQDTAMAGMSNGTYSGTLTITIEPS
tara:strand:+ start:100266 stop:100817 length:552 start_codon:yes stop_codon:yes gene_type:complete